jgi:hypothetical protein
MGFRGSRVQIPPSRLEHLQFDAPLVIVAGNSSAFGKGLHWYLYSMEARFFPADLLQLWQQRADYLHQFGDPNSA